MEYEQASQGFFQRERRRRARWMYRLVLLAVYVLVINWGMAGPSRFENPEYLIDNWQGSDGLREGLHENSASCVVQTPDGYLWVGTYGGLVRFNGNDFEVQDSVEGGLSPNEPVHRLYVDHEGRLWVATDRKILVLENGVWRTIQKFKIDETLIRTLAEDATGQIWCGTLDGKIYTVKNNNNDRQKVDEVIKYVQQSGGIGYAEEKMKQYREEALKILHSYPESPATKAMEELVNYVIDRKY